jgi:hypothetical protein
VSVPRRLLHVLTFASAVICVGSLLLVGRSIFRVDGVDGGRWWAATIDGHVIIYVEPPRPTRHEPLSYVGSQAAAPFREIRERLLNHRPSAVRWLRIGRVDVMKGVSVTILPFWPVTIVAAILPLRWWRRRRARVHARGFPVVDATAEQT